MHSLLPWCICDVRGQLPLPAKASQAATFHVVSRKEKMRMEEPSREGSDKERKRSHSGAVPTDGMRVQVASSGCEVRIRRLLKIKEPMGYHP